jgi:hypothetical protein
MSEAGKRKIFPMKMANLITKYGKHKEGKVVPALNQLHTTP